MEGVVSNDDRVAIAEVDYIIHHMNEMYLNKIPKKIVDYITILKKRNIEIYVDPKIPLEKQGLKELTLYFLMILNLKYWCNDQRRKDILSMMEKNQKKFDDKVNNIFEQAESIKTVSEENFENSENKPKQIKIVNNTIEKTEENAKEDVESVQEENSIAEKMEENFLTKIIKKIKSIFKRKEM